MKNRPLTLLASLTLAISATTLPAYAQSDATMTSHQIDARYDAAEKQCDAMKGDQKDICLKQADADKDTAKAQAKAAKKKAQADYKASKVKRNGDYDVAMKKCDALSGDAEDTCEAKVKTQYGK